MNFSSSRKVNPEGSIVKLTAEQVWKGMVIEARDPVRFIPDTTAVEATSDTGNKLIRKISFRGEPAIIQEITFHPNTITYCESHTDKTVSVSNVLSYDESNELVFTICIVGGPTPKQDAASTPMSLEETNSRVGRLVETTIRQIRELVQDGTIV